LKSVLNSVLSVCYEPCVSELLTAFSL